MIAQACSPFKQRPLHHSSLCTLQYVMTCADNCVVHICTLMLSIQVYCMYTHAMCAYIEAYRFCRSKH